MGTVFAECWKCDQCSHKWLKGEIYPSHCAKCRSRKWDSAKLMQQLESSLSVTPERKGFGEEYHREPPDKLTTQLLQVERPSIQELRDISAGKLTKDDIGASLSSFSLDMDKLIAGQSHDEVCGQLSEPDRETGERYTCGKAPHSGKIQHGQWRKA